MSGGWNTIESDAGVFTFLLNNLGAKDVQFEELLTLEPEALEALAPVYGVIFLFKYPTDAPYAATDKPLDGTFDYDASERIFFAAQTIQNACGTQALLSVLLNKDEEGGSSSGAGGDGGTGIDIGKQLREFRDFTMVLPPEFRGEALSNSELIRDAHNSFAKSSPFVDETQQQQRTSGDGAEDAFHFIAYTPIDGTLYELDGLQPAPISHGPCASGGPSESGAESGSGSGSGSEKETKKNEFPTKVMEVLQRRIARYDMSEIRFNLMAVVRDPRVRARAIGDLETVEREDRKRRDWQYENALRRHNFVGFAAAVLRDVVESKLALADGEEGGGGDEAYLKWIEEAKVKTKQRLESRRKGGGGGGGGGEDVEMVG